MKKTATIHCMYAEDDITNDFGWTGVQLYVAIDWNAPDHGPPMSGHVIAVHLDEVELVQLCRGKGYDTADATAHTFTHTGRGWVRRVTVG